VETNASILIGAGVAAAGAVCADKGESAPDTKRAKAAGVTAAIRRNKARKATVVVLVGEFIRRAP